MIDWLETLYYGAAPFVPLSRDQGDKPTSKLTVTPSASLG